MNTKLYTIACDNKVLSFGSRKKSTWTSLRWVLYRLKKGNLERLVVYVSDLNTLKIDKISAKSFYEMNKNPQELEAEILEYFGFKTDLTSLREMYSRDMFSSHNSTLVKDFLIGKGLL
jgi:hypothetical protein